jgi:hypothetical protein
MDVVERQVAEDQVKRLRREGKVAGISIGEVHAPPHAFDPRVALGACPAVARLISQPPDVGTCNATSGSARFAMARLSGELSGLAGAAGNGGRQEQRRGPLGAIEELHVDGSQFLRCERVLSCAGVSHIAWMRAGGDLQTDTVTGREAVRDWPQVKLHSP